MSTNVIFIESNLNMYQFKSQHMVNRYVAFISSRPIRRKRSKDTQVHHILPRSMYPDLEKDKRNLIRLTHREHFIAHWMLWKIFGHGPMSKAFFFMNNLHGMKICSKVYDSIVTDHIHSVSGEHAQMWGKFGGNHVAYGNKHTEDHKRRMSVINKERWANMTEEELTSNSAMRKIVMNRPETRQLLRDQKLGDKNPNYGMDITNSLSEEDNKRREENARQATRDYHAARPAWTKVEPNSPSDILWKNAADIIADSRGCTLIAKEYTGDKKWFNVVLRIKKRGNAGWVPSEDPSWCERYD